MFDYDAPSKAFKGGTTRQKHDAKCGFTCHTTVKARDYVFTDYGNR